MEALGSVLSTTKKNRGRVIVTFLFLWKLGRKMDYLAVGFRKTRTFFPGVHRALLGGMGLLRAFLSLHVIVISVVRAHKGGIVR